MTLTLQRFPAVTICNMSPFKASLVAQNEEISRILAIHETSARLKRNVATAPQEETEEIQLEAEVADPVETSDVSSLEVIEMDEAYHLHAIHRMLEEDKIQYTPYILSVTSYPASVFLCTVWAEAERGVR